MSTPKYRIYPSLLDKFQKFLDSDLVAEEFWNRDSEGKYKLTLEEISNQLEQELIDSINRVGKVPSEAADKGTAFNEVIDCLIESRKSEREDMTICSFRDDENPFIEAVYNKFIFRYDWDLCRKVAAIFKGCVPQYSCLATLETRYGEVELYGYVDYIGMDRICDLKTTKNYTFGNYKHYWQRYVYPFCMVESGEMQEVSEFEFTIVEWKERKEKPICGEIFKEVYTYSHEESKQKIKEICEHFIGWLESRRDRITDKKIFGGEND